MSSIICGVKYALSCPAASWLELNISMRMYNEEGESNNMSALQGVDCVNTDVSVT